MQFRGPTTILQGTVAWDGSRESKRNNFTLIRSTSVLQLNPFFIFQNWNDNLSKPSNLIVPTPLKDFLFCSTFPQCFSQHQCSLNTLANSFCRAIHKQGFWEETQKCLASLKRRKPRNSYMTESSGLKYMDAISPGTIKVTFNLSDVRRLCPCFLKNKQMTPKP